MVLTLYELAWRPAAALIRRTDAQVAHDRLLTLLRHADDTALVPSLARLVQRAAFRGRPADVGGVRLPQPIILAAGLVKGEGFPDEAAALAAVDQRRNVVAGWRALPALVGAVEFGSFTRHPRLGNPGRVVWRDHATRSMQNRIGLRNPGARAAAAYLRAHADALPPVWGINLAVSPGLSDPLASEIEIREAAGFFEEAFPSGTTGPTGAASPAGSAGTTGLAGTAGPAWLTLNLSCPNTEDDPRGRQSGELAERLCGALARVTQRPLWLKVGPDLSDEQLRTLLTVCSATGVRAIVATNTWAQPAPTGSGSAGLSGARLRPLALDTVRRITAIVADAGAGIDVVACGGILDGRDLLAFEKAGARAAMLYSALVFRGPLAAALILREAGRRGRHA